MAALAGEAGQVVVVRPAGWADALQGWKAYRQGQGYQVLEVEPAASAEATRQRIADAVQPSTAELKAVVLMADTVSYAERDQPLPADRIPTFYVESKVVKDYGSEPWIATDFPFGDLDGDGVVEAAVGRIPASSRQVLEDYLRRVVAYPQTAFGE
ncbi:MAG: C25 family cysteine peptidase, partial [Pirellulaceae bacterium]